MAAADELGLTQAQLNDFVNAHPGQLRVEGPLRNQSHIDEMPGVDRLDPIQDDMVEFFNRRFGNISFDLRDEPWEIPGDEQLHEAYPWQLPSVST